MPSEHYSSEIDVHQSTRTQFEVARDALDAALYAEAEARALADSGEAFDRIAADTELTDALDNINEIVAALSVTIGNDELVSSALATKVATSLDTDGTLKVGAVDAAAVIANNVVTEAHLNSSVAGNGLAGGGGTALSVNTDDTTIEKSGDALRVKDAGITNAKMASDVKIGSLASLLTTIKTSVVAAINELVASVASIAGGAGVTNARLKEWTTAKAYEMTSITYHATSSLAIASAVVTWPDGSAGVFTATTINGTYQTVDAYTLSHTLSGKTVTQALMTRNIDGNVTTKPALTVV